MRDTRYKMPKQTRKIGGKVYHYLEWRKLKAEATKAAEFWRGRGESVRVARSNNGYAIYTRKEG